jgi:hypothetical protein
MIQFSVLWMAARSTGRSAFMRHSVGLVLVGWVFLPWAGQRLVAGTVSWDGDTSTNWTTGTNWVGDIDPTDDTTTDLAAFVFASAPDFQPNAETRSIAGILIGDGTTAVPTFTISGTSLTIGGSGMPPRPTRPFRLRPCWPLTREGRTTPSPWPPSAAASPPMETR